MTFVLPDTTLCVIVRDEMMNPSGGIIDFVEIMAPQFEEAVLIDTGSIDGTREALEELEEKHDNVRVYDHLWKGFADGRNRAIAESDTKYCLHLDADERLFEEDLLNLAQHIDGLGDVGPIVVRLSFDNIYSCGKVRNNFGAGNRFGNRNYTYFKGVCYEDLRVKPVWDADSESIIENSTTFQNLYQKFYDEEKRQRPDTFDSYKIRHSKLLAENSLYRKLTFPEPSEFIRIKHFLSTEENDELKQNAFYNTYYGKQSQRKILDDTQIASIPSPSEVEGFQRWRELNPQRLKFPCSDYLLNWVRENSVEEI